MGRNLAGVSRLVKGIFGESDRKCLDRLGRMLCRKSGHGRRIDAAREQNAQRHIGNKTHPHGVRQQIPQLRRCLIERRRMAVLRKCQIPVSPRLYFAVFYRHYMSCGKLGNTFIDRVGRGYIIEREILPQSL